ncbi:MAG: hypothetical protein R2991_16630 [Thermoanaerobaculia bacterium]
MAAAFAVEKEAGHRCNGLAEIQVAELGLVNSMTHCTRWSAG